ncbi:MAG: 3'-5' exonuclease [Umezawaea sp.]
MAADAELVARVERDRLLGSDQAAARLKIRPSDWKWVRPAGWIAPVDHTWMKVGRDRHVKCDLFRTEDVDALLEIPDVDWEAVWACGKGEASPLRRYAPKLAPTRAEVIRRWIAEYGDLAGVDVWARYDGRHDTWTLDWDTDDEGLPTVAQVRQAVADDPVIAAHLKALVFGSAAGDVTRWARAMLEPDVAVLVDVETTGLAGAVIEVAVIDAATGATLLDTLVHPGDIAIEPGARAVHGITLDHLATARTWDKIAPKIRKVTKDRIVLAYNAEFDRGRIVADCERYGLRPMHLADPHNWGCVMNRRSDYLRTRRWVALGGGHRALGDCHSARDVLIGMARLDEGTARKA